jgi:F-type H+-transporting ATPase subunit gamma
MANTRELLRRRKSARSTRKITKTMEKVATAKLAKAQNAAVAARPYSNKLKEIIADVAGASTGFQHPLLEKRANPKKAVVIVLTSDRGMCGAFNVNIINKARTLIRELDERKIQAEYIVQGKKGIGVFRYLNLPVAEKLVGISDKPTYAKAEEIANRIILQYGRGELDEAYIVHSGFKPASVNVPVIEKILPLTSLAGDAGEDAKAAAPAAAAKGPAQSYIFHPGAKEILEGVLPMVVKMAIFTAMLQNTAAEHAARRLAMKNATDSADDMIKDLTRLYNRARQGKITQEIAEIVGGAAALD